MDRQNKLTAYTIPTHHVTHRPTNLLKSNRFSLASKEYNDGAVTRHQHNDSSSYVASTTRGT